MRVRVASKFLQRSLGLIPKQFCLDARLTAKHADLTPSSIDPGVMFFPRCRSLHTICMVRNVDMAFIDAQNCVLKCCREVPPLQAVFCPGASAALERFSCDAWWPVEGEMIRLEEEI